ncbi:hypothetical protein FGD77_18875 [Roseovarius sp. M141]|nr:hypothetical protein [Roseovarius sp. M141]
MLQSSHSLCTLPALGQMPSRESCADPRSGGLTRPGRLRPHPFDILAGQPGATRDYSFQLTEEI